MARIDRANKDDELGKYKIKLVALEDDQANPSTDLTDVQNLIERDHVFALAPVITEGFEQPPATFAADHDVPYFGAGFSPGFCKPYTWGYSFTGCDIGGGYYGEQPIASVATHSASRLSRCGGRWWDSMSRMAQRRMRPTPK